VKRAAASALILLWVAACATPGRVLEPLDPDDPLPRALMVELDTRAQSHNRMIAALSLALDAPDTRFRRPLRLAVERPSRMRMEILALFGQIAAVLVTQDGQFQFFDAKTQQIESGEVTRNLLWQMAGVDLSVPDAIDLLLGAPHPGPGWTPAGAYRAGADGWVVAYRDAARDLLEHFEFGPDRRLRAMVRMDDSGSEVWRAEFSDYREIRSARETGADAADTATEEVAGHDFAFKVALEFFKIGAHAELEFKSVSLDPELSDQLFRLPAVSADSGPQ
jgi:outer membrane biogenesis lipoprotein LolB